MEGENGHHGRCPLSSVDSSQLLKQDLDLLAIGCTLCNQVYALDYIISHFLHLQFIAPSTFAFFTSAGVSLIYKGLDILLVNDLCIFGGVKSLNGEE